jgi:hypothetical protein
MTSARLAANMLRELLESDEALGPSVRVSLERVAAVLEDRGLFYEDPEGRRRDAAKRRVAAGLRSASADELADLAKALGVKPAFVKELVASRS